MKKLKLVLDSACDISIEQANKDNIALIPFNVSFDNSTYLKENIDISFEEFYKNISEKNMFPKTSLPNITEYINIFEQEMSNGNDILCICLSSKLSGSYQCAVNAKEIVLEAFPNGKICIVDSLLVTYPYYLLGLQGLNLYKSGKSLEEIEKILLGQRDNTRAYFMLDSLNFLEKGGRIGKTSVLASNILNIKPLIEFKNGDLNPIKKIRTLKKAMRTSVEILQKEINDKTQYLNNYELIIMYGGSPMYMEQIKQELYKKFDPKKYDIRQVNIGPTILSHTGPSVVGVGFTVLIN